MAPIETGARNEVYALARRAGRSSPAFWVGTRFYDRHDLHISDFWYRDPSGFGGGVEEVPLGDRARFAASWIGGTQDQLDPNGQVPLGQLYRFNKNTFEARAYALDVASGRVSIAFDLAHFNGDEVSTGAAPIVVEDSLGVAGTAIIEWPIPGGRYKSRCSMALAPPAISDRS